MSTLQAARPMTCLGVDPSSGGYGWGITQAGRKLLASGQYTPPSPRHKKDRETTAKGMIGFAALLLGLKRQYDITHVVVEQVSVTMGTHTVRMLAYSEAVPIMFSAAHGCRLQMIQATSARAKVYPGNGVMSKESVYDLVAEEFTDIDWLEVPPKYNIDKNMDRSDGIVLSLAGHLLEWPDEG